MEFKPVLRFAVMSDCHYSERHPEYRERMKNTIEYLYKYSKGESYNKLDALYVVGDFTNLGKKEEMQWFSEDINSVIKPGTVFVATMANHELHYMPDYNVALENFKEIYKMDYDRHEVINGYHFISLSGIRDKGPWDDSFNDEKKEFLKNELEIARKDTGNKPIFVFQHAGIPETVFGGYGGHTEIYSILSAYPQIIDFSGHSHNPVNDPREINQKNFTCVGTGSMAYLSTSAGWGDFHIKGDPSLGAQHAHMLIVEVDEVGKVRILGLDADEQKFISDNLIVDCHDKSKYQYTLKRALTASNPYFEEGAKATVTINEGKALITFPAAKSVGERVKEYNIRLYDSNMVAMGQKNVYSDYMHYKQKDEFTVEIDWEYDFVPNVEIYAGGFWENFSQCIKS